MLCGRCSECFATARIYPFSSFNGKTIFKGLGNLHSDYASFKTGLETQCKFCHRIADKFVSANRCKILCGDHLGADIEPESFRMKYKFTYENKSRRILCFFCIISARKSTEQLQNTARIYLLLSPEQQPLKTRTDDSAVDFSNNSHSSLIRHWMSECMKQHRLCHCTDPNMSVDSNVRFLEVGENTSSPHVKLCLSSSIARGSSYMTLSHCWGGKTAEMPLLTMATYDQYRNNIYIADLPATFRDAVQVVRELRIRYLWIDSLCIIQDSPEDWLTQSTLMGGIYRHSVLNIAATGSENPHGGLFTQRDRTLITPLRVQVASSVPRVTRAAVLVDEDLGDELPYLRLENDSTVVACASTPLPEMKKIHVDLDPHIGNHDGTFDITGQSFSSSARNVHIRAGYLEAELATVDGRWQRSSIALGTLLNALGKDTRPLSVGIDSPSTLILSYPASRYIDLDTRLGNSNGCFDPQGKDFSRSARQVTIEGFTLHAELQTVRGQWKWDSIDIDTFITEVREDSGVDLALAQYKVLEKAFLTITVPPPAIRDRPARLDLNTCLGNDNGHFQFGGKDFTTNGHNMSLTGTTLSAQLRREDNEFSESSIDLKNFLKWTKAGLSARRVVPAPDGIACYYDVDTDYIGMWSVHVNSAPLNTRGWVVQERLLAPRIVHFGKRQLFWECTQSRSLEERPHVQMDDMSVGASRSGLSFKTWNIWAHNLTIMPPPRDLSLNYIWSSMKAMFGRERTTFTKEKLRRDSSLLSQARFMCYGDDHWISTHALLRYWDVIIGKFVQTKLSFAEDRLVAVAGLAQVLSMRTSIRYVGGLWAYQLPRQLLWTISYLRKDPLQSDMYIAPSWSWASRTGTGAGKSQNLISDPLLDSKGAMDLINIISIELTAVGEAGEQSFGRLCDGRMRIRGRLLPIALDMKIWPRGATRRDKLVRFWTGDHISAPTRDTFLVPVLFARWHNRLAAGTPNALLLEWTGERGSFRRIGVAWLSSTCPLREIVPDLYNARLTHYEDEDDDACTDNELDPKEPHPYAETSGPPIGQGIVLTPQQELYEMQIERAGATLERLQKWHERKRSSSVFPESLSLMSDRLQSVKPYQSSRTMATESDRATRELQQLLPDMAVSCSTRNNPWNLQKPLLEKPLAAVQNCFYCEYIDYDRVVAQYGCFVFEIV